MPVPSVVRTLFSGAVFGGALVVAACGGTSGPPAEPTSAPSEAETPAAEPDAPDAMTEPGHHRHGGMQHDFSDVDHWVSVFEAPSRDAWQRPEHTVSLLELEPGDTVADLGAGTGYFLPYLRDAVGDDGAVIALDVEPTLVEHMNAHASDLGWTNVEARVVPYDDPGLQPQSVDRVITVNTWHHIEDREAYAARLAEALRPGGAVFVVDFTMESERGPGRDHRLTPEQVAAELEAGGLEATIAEDDGLDDQYVIVGRRPAAAPQ